MSKVQDLTGHVFGRLTVLRRVASRRVKWLCLCSCGTETAKDAGNLKAGVSRSCGCLQKEDASARFRKHGQVGSPLYEVWAGMIARCENPKHKGFKDYGGRGIVVCRCWRESFAAFLEDMGQRPSDHYSLDRIDLNGHYEPGNVRWATKTQQMRNMTTNRLLTYQGRTLTVVEWAEVLGIPKCRIYMRLHRGKSDAEALAS